jgi:hypothetical protein
MLLPGRIATSVAAGDVMVTDLATTDAAEEAFHPIRAGTIEAVGFLVVDPPHLEAGMQVIPHRRFVGVKHHALLNPALDPVESMAL